MAETFGGLAAIYEAGAHDIPGIKWKSREWPHAEAFIERVALAIDSDVKRVQLRKFAATALQSESEALDYFVDAEAARKTHDQIRTFLAAECSAFLHGFDLAHEKTKPYLNWKDKLLPQNDTILTFNYDRVPDELGLWCPLPKACSAGAQDSAKVLKMHGSVDWRVEPSGEVEVVTPLDRDLFVSDDTLGIATPGPDKRLMCEHVPDPDPSERRGTFFPLWKEAEKAIGAADAIVVVGYSFPPSDAMTRDSLFGWMKSAAKNQGRRAETLRVHTVLGANLASEQSNRIRGMLRSMFNAPTRNCLDIQQWPMYAEDFVSLLDRDRLFEHAAP